jgi:hypothetical protein
MDWRKQAAEPREKIVRLDAADRLDNNNTD